jgi:biopolymer transport protein TolR
MLQTWRKPAKLFSDFNTLQFACVMGIIIFVLLTLFMTAPTPHGGIGLDVPRVLHPAPMPGADRKDAIKVAITRDDMIFFGPDRVYDPADLSNKIKDALRNPDVEHKVYIKADARADWGRVKLVLQEAHDAGIIRVAFLADQRHIH